MLRWRARSARALSLVAPSAQTEAMGCAPLRPWLTLCRPLRGPERDGEGGCAMRPGEVWGAEATATGQTAAGALAQEPDRAPR
jgi:hypothetical protein